MDNTINDTFKNLTKRVAAEPDVEKATQMLLTGIADTLYDLRDKGTYPLAQIDTFVEQLRSHAPMWAQAVTVVGSPDRQTTDR